MRIFKRIAFWGLLSALLLALFAFPASAAGEDNVVPISGSWCLDSRLSVPEGLYLTQDVSFYVPYRIRVTLDGVQTEYENVLYTSMLFENTGAASLDGCGGVYYTSSALAQNGYLPVYSEQHQWFAAMYSLQDRGLAPVGGEYYGQVITFAPDQKVSHEFYNVFTSHAERVYCVCTSPDADANGICDRCHLQIYATPIFKFSIEEIDLSNGIKSGKVYSFEMHTTALTFGDLARQGASVTHPELGLCKFEFYQENNVIFVTNFGTEKAKAYCLINPNGYEPYPASIKLPLDKATAYYAGSPCLAIGHYYTDWITSLEPTCIQRGVQVRVCGVCLCEETKDLPALGPAYDIWGNCKYCDGNLFGHKATDSAYDDVTLGDAIENGWNELVDGGKDLLDKVGSSVGGFIEDVGGGGNGGDGEDDDPFARLKKWWEDFKKKADKAMKYVLLIGGVILFFCLLPILTPIFGFIVDAVRFCIKHIKKFLKKITKKRKKK